MYVKWDLEQYNMCKFHYTHSMLILLYVQWIMTLDYLPSSISVYCEVKTYCAKNFFMSKHYEK